ncbi:MAG: PAS domain-containing sensor histidine kinase [Ferruginibacter sp.]
MSNQPSPTPKPTGLSISYKSSPFISDLINTIPDAVIITNPDFTIIGMNKTAEGIYHGAMQDLIGKPLFDYIKFELVGESTLEDAVKDLFTDGFWIGDIIYLKDDQKVFYNTRCTLIKDQNEKVTSIVFVNRNVADLIIQKQELKVAENKYETVVESLTEGVIMIDRYGKISTYNRRAAEILGVPSHAIVGKAIGSNEWKMMHEDGTPFPMDQFPALDSLKTGKEHNNVVLGYPNASGNITWISINSRPIYKDGRITPDESLASFKDITEIKKIHERLKESELIFRTFMKNSPTLGWIYDAEGNFVYGNPHFRNIVGLDEEDVGKSIEEVTSTQALKELIVTRNRQVIDKGAPVIAEDEVPDKNGNIRCYLSYWFLLPLTDKRKLIGGHAVEITDRKKSRRAIEEMYERYTYALNASSDAIWDYDFSTNTIYRNDAFFSLTGYKKDEVALNLEWLFEHIHPHDQRRIKVSLDSSIKQGLVHWENEYRFRKADNTYINILDKAVAIYDNEQLVRVIGAIQDITQQKEQQTKILNTEVQKQKLINKATLKAQEQERNRISGELHDNVNQLLMSAKLHIGVAKNNEKDSKVILDKATKYLMMAVDEIRNLTRKLNSSVVNITGLVKSIEEIANSLQLSEQIKVKLLIKEELVLKLDEEQKLMVYRIIQEQSNNILKYAKATEVTISMEERHQIVHLTIADNGIGFDKKTQKSRGIGFINIFNRADAYNGQVEIKTSPGNGCVVHVRFPLAH